MVRGGSSARANARDRRRSWAAASRGPGKAPAGCARRRLTDDPAAVRMAVGAPTVERTERHLLDQSSLGGSGHRLKGPRSRARNKRRPDVIRLSRPARARGRSGTGGCAHGPLARARDATPGEGVRRAGIRAATPTLEMTSWRNTAPLPSRPLAAARPGAWLFRPPAVRLPPRESNLRARPRGYGGGSRRRNCLSGRGARCIL